MMDHEKQSFEIGTLLQEHYVIEELISDTPVSRTYKCMNLQSNKFVAVKELIIKSFWSNEEKEQALKQFQVEANVLMSLTHPNLPKFEDYFSFEGCRFLVMEFVEGKSLQDIVEDSVTFQDEGQVIAWAIELCEVLEYLHNRKPKPVIFRGLCPENVILSKNNKLKLIDFGISKLFDFQAKTIAVAKTGKTFYAPIEQYTGQTDVRSDIYSFGSTLYFLITKTPPVDSVIRSLDDMELTPCCKLNPNISPELEKIISKSMELIQENRYQTITEIINQLRVIKSKRPLPLLTPHKSFLQDKTDKSLQDKYDTVETEIKKDKKISSARTVIKPASYKTSISPQGDIATKGPSKELEDEKSDQKEFRPIHTPPVPSLTKISKTPSKELEGEPPVSSPLKTRRIKNIEGESTPKKFRPIYKESEDKTSVPSPGKILRTPSKELQGEPPVSSLTKISKVPSKELEDKPSISSPLKTRNLKDIEQEEEVGLSVGTILRNTYVIDELLSSSNTSRVYKGRYVKKNKEIIIKELIITSFDNQEEKELFLKQFMQETKILQSLSHPNLPKFEDYLSYKDSRFIVMEYIKGEKLSNLIDREDNYPKESQILDWGIILCEILEYLHGRKPNPIIFRGLCPENIILTETGNLKFIDFGVSKFNPQAQTSAVAKTGKMHFAPMEQHSGHTDETSDIYSLCATLYYLATKTPPFDCIDRTIDGIELTPCRQINPNISPELENIILKGMELQKQDRFQKATELKEELLTLKNLKEDEEPDNAIDDDENIEYDLELSDEKETSGGIMKFFKKIFGMKKK